MLTFDDYAALNVHQYIYLYDRIFAAITYTNEAVNLFGLYCAGWLDRNGNIPEYAARSFVEFDRRDDETWYHSSSVREKFWNQWSILANE